MQQQPRARYVGVCVCLKISVYYFIVITLLFQSSPGGVASVQCSVNTL